MFFIHNFVFFLFGRFSKNLSILTSEIFLTFLTPLTFLTCLQAVLNRSSDAEHIPNADVNKIQILIDHLPSSIKKYLHNNFYLDSIDMQKITAYINFYFLFSIFQLLGCGSFTLATRRAFIVFYKAGRILTISRLT